MELLQYFHIHTGFIIVAFRESTADDLHQVRITGIVLRQQHQMVITVLSAGQFLVKPGATYTSQPRIGIIPASLAAR